MHYDALIVGAGPAGCAAAYDLAHAGRRVLLLDRRTFPRHKACACGLTRKTLKALRYSVEPILERQCRDVVLQEAGPAFLRGRRSADKSCEVRVRLRQPFCAMAVRARFDHFCLQQTLAAGRKGGGAELLHIDQLLTLRELPTHIELDVLLPDGQRQTLFAPALIGADGSNGQTRRLAAGLAQPTGRPSAAIARPLPTVGREAHTSHLPEEPDWYARGFALETTIPYTLLPAKLPAGDHPHDLVFDFAPIAGGYGWLFPKADHINIGVGGFIPQKPAPNTNREGGASATESAPPPGDNGMQYETVTRTLLATYIREKLGLSLETLTPNVQVHTTGQHLGLGGHAYAPQGRVLLTGDAAGLIDPLTGEGIHSAITSGQAAAAALLEVIPEGIAKPYSADELASTPTSWSKRSSAASAGGLPGTPQASEASLSASQTAGATQAAQLAAAYARHLRPLQETLAFSHRAARSFYREPERGFKVMRSPLLRNLVLKTYADGLPTTKLLASLARRVA